MGSALGAELLAVLGQRWYSLAGSVAIPIFLILHPNKDQNMTEQINQLADIGSEDQASRFAAVYEAGLRAAASAQIKESELLESGVIVNLPQMQLTDGLADRIQEIPPLTFYRSLMVYGPHDCLDSLAVMSPEQFTGLMDLSAWTSDDRLSLLKATKWLDLLNNINPEILCEKFSQLEEEVQLGLLSPYIAVYTQEDYEKMSDQEQDQLVAMPCQTLFYKILSDDKAIQTSIQNIIAAALSFNLPYAYNLLAHAAYIPPNESEAEAARFRQARLEDEGFVPKQEGLEYFASLDAHEFAKEIKDHYELNSRSELIDLDVIPTKLFLDQVLNLASRELSTSKVDELTARIRLAANAVTPLSGIDPEDFAACRNLLQQLKGFLSMGLEFFSSARQDVALEMLQNYYPKTMMQAVTGLYKTPRMAFLSALEKHLSFAPDKFSEQFQKGRQGSLLLNLERHLSTNLSALDMETVKGFFNRFPLLPVAVDEKNQRFGFRAVASVRDFSEQLFKCSEILASLILRKKAGFPVAEGAAKLELQVLMSQVKDILEASHGEWDMLLAAGVGDCSERVYENVAKMLMSELQS